MRDGDRAALALARARREQFLAALDALVPDRNERARRFSGARRIIELLRRVLPYRESTEGVRAADLRDWLREASILSRKLRRVLLNVSEPLYLYEGFMFPRGWPGESPPVRQALANAEILGVYENPELNRSGLYARLRALEAFCEEAPKHIPKNVGGTRTLHRKFYGSPKALLVSEAADAYTDFWCDRITGSDEGPFYEFAAAVYELVTGTEGRAARVGLKRYVEFMAPRYRELAVHGLRLQQLGDRMMSARLTKAEEQERLRLQKRCKELNKEFVVGPHDRVTRSTGSHRGRA